MAGENRVAASPETVKKFTALGFSVTVERGAGLGSSFADDLYVQAGAVIGEGAAQTASGSTLVLKVRAPSAEELAVIPPGAMLVGMLSPYQDKAAIADYAARKIDAFAMEFVPRITRAQSMDVLSSQANLAGYRAVIEAAALFGRAFPLMMTAAGTVPPAKVFIMGAGVAGLQAIATARRLGAQVSATDVRPAVKEQVQSLGATFVMVEDEETKAAETSGGYAREMSADYKKKQAALVAETIKKQDIVITTALIPGRPAPVLVTEDMVRSMKPGSVIVDMAVEQGGNCPLSKSGQIVDAGSVRIAGFADLPSRIAADASALYARNLYNFVVPLVDRETKGLKINWDDDIIKGAGLTRAGAVVHPSLATAGGQANG